MHSNRSAKWLFYISLIACLALLLGAADGKGHGRASKGGPKKVNGLDRNNDGKIERGEWRGNNRSFIVHDRNGDGVLSGAEIDPVLQTDGYDDFSEVDRDGDGRVLKRDWRWDRAEFDRIDDNHDGVITREEYVDTIGDDGGASYSHFPDVDRSPEVLTAPVTSRLENRHAQFGELDRNNNGAISFDEWGSDRQSFDTLDRNHNGSLSREEFRKLSVEARLRLFEGFDQNGNGVITRSEWSGDKQSFNRLDSNDDGKLGRDEFMRRYNELEQRFNSMDKDNNGSVSRQEWRQEKKMFDRLDDDHDGQLSFDEFAGVR